MTDEHEVELAVTREEAATVLRRVADGVIGGTVRVGDADESVDVAIPEEVELDLEFETEDGERSLEVELEWETDEEDEDEDEAEEEGEEEEDDETPEDAAVDEEPPAVPGLDEPSPSGARFELFEDRADEWRWRLVHRNGNVIATSGEGYTRKHNARKGLQSVIQNAPSADVVDEPASRD